MREKEVLKICSIFRAELEKSASKCPYQLSPFPNGWCGYASRALGAYLMQLGYGEFSYVLGYRGQASHAWLEQDGWIIDITADQFQDGVPGVMVTEDATYHSVFQFKTSRPIDLADMEYDVESWIIKLIIRTE